jgi:hypothetical protein
MCQQRLQAGRAPWAFIDMANGIAMPIIDQGWNGQSGKNRADLIRIDGGDAEIDQWRPTHRLMNVNDPFTNHGVIKRDRET